MLNGLSYLFDATTLDDHPFGHAGVENYNYAGLVVQKEEKWIEPKMLFSENIHTQYYDFNNLKYTKKSTNLGYFNTSEFLDEEIISNSIDVENWNLIDESEEEKDGFIKKKSTYLMTSKDDLITIENPLSKIITDYDFTDQKNRFSPYEFTFPYVIEARIILKLSNSSKIKNIESFKDKVYNEDLGIAYSQEIKKKEKSLTLNYKFVFSKTMIENDLSNQLEQYFNTLRSKLNHQIIIEY